MKKKKETETQRSKRQPKHTLNCKLIPIKSTVLLAVVQCLSFVYYEYWTCLNLKSELFLRCLEMCRLFKTIEICDNWQTFMCHVVYNKEHEIGFPISLDF